MDHFPGGAPRCNARDSNQVCNESEDVTGIMIWIEADFARTFVVASLEND